EREERRARHVVLGLLAAYLADPRMLDDHVLFRFKETAGVRYLRDLPRDAVEAEVARAYRRDGRGSDPQRRAAPARGESMRIAVGADHAGYTAKEEVMGWLRDWGHEVDDLGTHGPDPVDYPLYAARVAAQVAGRRDDLGILVCGSGIGVCIAANKVPGIRAAYATDT